MYEFINICFEVLCPGNQSNGGRQISHYWTDPSLVHSSGPAPTPVSAPHPVSWLELVTNLHAYLYQSLGELSFIISWNTWISKTVGKTLQKAERENRRTLISLDQSYRTSPGYIDTDTRLPTRWGSSSPSINTRLATRDEVVVLPLTQDYWPDVC